MVSQIKKLYAIEAKAKALSADERYRVRQRESLLVIEQIKT